MLRADPIATARRRKAGAAEQLVHVDVEGYALVGADAGADRLDGGNHAAVAAEHAVGERHQASVRHRTGRGTADRPRDIVLATLRVEHARTDERRRRRAADAGIA